MPHVFWVTFLGSKLGKTGKELYFQTWKRWSWLLFHAPFVWYRVLSLDAAGNSLLNSVVWFFSPETSAGTFGSQCWIWRLTAPGLVEDMCPGDFPPNNFWICKTCSMRWIGLLPASRELWKAQQARSEKAEAERGRRKKWSESWTSVVWTMAKASIISCSAWKWWSWFAGNDSKAPMKASRSGIEIPSEHRIEYCREYASVCRVIAECIFSTYQIPWKCLFAALILQEVLQTKMTPCDDPSTTQWNWNCWIQRM